MCRHSRQPVAHLKCSQHGLLLYEASFAVLSSVLFCERWAALQCLRTALGQALQLTARVSVGVVVVVVVVALCALFLPAVASHRGALVVVAVAAAVVVNLRRLIRSIVSSGVRS